MTIKLTKLQSEALQRAIASSRVEELKHIANKKKGDNNFCATAKDCNITGSHLKKFVELGFIEIVDFYGRTTRHNGEPFYNGQKLSNEDHFRATDKGREYVRLNLLSGYGEQFKPFLNMGRLKGTQADSLWNSIKVRTNKILESQIQHTGAIVEFSTSQYSNGQGALPYLDSMGIVLSYNAVYRQTVHSEKYDRVETHEFIANDENHAKKLEGYGYEFVGYQYSVAGLHTSRAIYKVRSGYIKPLFDSEWTVEYNGCLTVSNSGIYNYSATIYPNSNIRFNYPLIAANDINAVKAFNEFIFHCAKNIYIAIEAWHNSTVYTVESGMAGYMPNSITTADSLVSAYDEMSLLASDCETPTFESFCDGLTRNDYYELFYHETMLDLPDEDRLPDSTKERVLVTLGSDDIQ